MATSERTLAHGPFFVTNRDFNRAESHRYFKNAIASGGAGKFHHMREMPPIDKQTVLRGNRDTLYSAGVFDLDAGPVTVTLPDTGGRYMSMIAIDEEHYALETVYSPGTFVYTGELLDTRYVLLAIHTFADPNDPNDMEKAHALQDAVRTEQLSIGTFKFPNWDPLSREIVRAELLRCAAAIPDTKDMFGPKAKVDPDRHLIGSAIGWGTNAPEDAFYVHVVPPENDGRTVHNLTIKGKVPVDGFWSVSVYGADGYYKANELNSYTINGTTAKKNADGSVTIHFGGCSGKASNCLPVTPGWSYCLRFYRPHKEILDGTWKIPMAEPVSSTALYWV